MQSDAANPRLTSPPSVIADAIAEAVTAQRPKIRNVAGRWARPLLTARRILLDRTFDAVMGLVVRFGQLHTRPSRPRALLPYIDGVALGAGLEAAVVVNLAR